MPFTARQSFATSLALRRPGDLCAVTPEASRVKPHDERRRNVSLVAGTITPALLEWPVEFGLFQSRSQEV